MGVEVIFLITAFLDSFIKMMNTQNSCSQLIQQKKFRAQMNGEDYKSSMAKNAEYCSHNYQIWLDSLTISASTQITRLEQVKHNIAQGIFTEVDPLLQSTFELEKKYLSMMFSIECIDTFTKFCATPEGGVLRDGQSILPVAISFFKTKLPLKVKNDYSLYY